MIGNNNSIYNKAIIIWFSVLNHLHIKATLVVDRLGINSDFKKIKNQLLFFNKKNVVTRFFHHYVLLFVQLGFK